MVLSTFLQGINPFSADVPLLNPLKTSENRRFSDVYRGYWSGTLVENGLTLGFSDTNSFREIWLESW